MEINRNKQTNIFIGSGPGDEGRLESKRENKSKGLVYHLQQETHSSPPPSHRPDAKLLAQVPTFCHHSEAETVISALT